MREFLAHLANWHAVIFHAARHFPPEVPREEFLVRPSECELNHDFSIARTRTKEKTVQRGFPSCRTVP